MTWWYEDLTQQAIEYYDKNETPLFQAHKYWEQYGKGLGLPEPEILLAKPSETGPNYLALIGLFKVDNYLVPNLHHLFIEVVDKNGRRMNGLQLYYGWDGMTTDQERNITPVILDKPDTGPYREPGGNIGITWDQVIYGFHIPNWACDRFRGIHTRYYGHDCHYVVYQERSGNIVDPVVPPDPNPDPNPGKKITMLNPPELLSYQDKWVDDDVGVMETIIRRRVYTTK